MFKKYITAISICLLLVLISSSTANAIESIIREAESYNSMSAPMKVVDEGETIEVGLREGTKIIEDVEYPHQELELRIPGREPLIYSLGVQVESTENQWRNSTEMQGKIKHL